jgi:uncharacterized membrane protein
MEGASLIALQTGTVIGLTALASKIIPEKARNLLLPVIAMLIGIGVIVLPEYVNIAPYLQGIILGGSATGLYAVAKEIKTAE